MPTEPGQLGGQGCASTQQVEPRLEEYPKAKHNDAYTNKIVEGLRSELYDLLALAEEFMSDLMWTTLNYLHKFWDQLFAYRKDGEYTIDNLAAERAIRPLTVQR